MRRQQWVKSTLLIRRRPRRHEFRRRAAREIRVHPLATINIRVLINPTEPDHRQLYETITDATERLQVRQSLDEETLRDTEVITTLA